MRTVSSKDRMRSGNNSDISAFLLGAAFQAAHFFPLCLNAEARWMRYQRVRSLGVFFLLTLFGGLLAWHLWVLQFNPHIAGRNLAEVNKRWHSYDKPQGKRGSILFRDGSLLAGNRKVARVLLEPTLIEDDALPTILAVLDPLTKENREQLRAKATNKSRQGIVAAERVTLEQARQIKAVRIPYIDARGKECEKPLRGVFLYYYYERDYPHGDFGAATTVGYAGRDAEVHRTGLERYWEDSLKGADGSVEYARDRNRRRLPASIKAKAPAPGVDVTTTLDPAVQLICESELRTALKANQSDWACIVVMEPQSGEILGAATWPTFDPNKYAQGEVGSELNVLTQRVFEPGSTAKPLLAAAAIDKGWVPENKHYVCTRHLTINGYTVREAELDEVIGGPGGAPLKDIIVHSSNIGMAQLALGLGQRKVFDAYSDFGFFQKSGVELPGESRGLRPHGYAGLNSSWPRITLANTGFGQGMAVTPLQLATAYCALANGGIAVRPTLVMHAAGEGTDDADKSGEVQLPPGESLLAGFGVSTARAAGTGSQSKPDGVRILSTQTCTLINSWLAEVVKSGTGERAKLDRYAAAGKTGTAQVPSQRGGYRKGDYTANFVGFFPVENPRYVVAVIFGEPRGGYYGGSVAAPVFKRVADRISYLQTVELSEASNAAR